jgi:hypothetical protein
MAIITPTLPFKSTTLEGLLLELLQYIQTQENVNGNFNNINGTINQDDLTYSANVTLPLTMAWENTGKISFTTANYLALSAITPNSNTTFKSPNPIGLLYEIMSYMQLQENDPVKNAQKVNNIKGTIDIDTLQFRGTVTLTLEFSSDGQGNLVIKAKEYLL